MRMIGDRPKTEAVGMRIFVAGKLVQRKWQDNDGEFRSRSFPSGVRPQAGESKRRGLGWVPPNGAAAR